jgi:acyl-CoA synthetase (AMP-forming)/AMP-acid ligase II
MKHIHLGPITETLDHVLESEPNRNALVAASGALSYRDLDAAANAAAAALVELGVRPGDRVAASLPNDTDIVVAFHGAMRLGAIWVGINRPLAPVEKEELLAAADPALFLADADTAATHARRWRTIPARDPDGKTDWSRAVAAFPNAARPPTPDPKLPAGIAFTSGTTGAPKGIVHSQRNLLLPAASLVASRGYDETLRKGDCLPLTILNLQVLTTLVTSRAGGCCILTDRRDARGVAQWIAKESVNVWNGVPAILYSMTQDQQLDPGLLATLRDVWTGGAPCPEELFEAFHSRFGLKLHQSYGLTEAPTVVSIEPLEGQHVPGSSGRVLPHLEVAICDDAGSDLPVANNGEIVVRAARGGQWAGEYTAMLGYWNSGELEPFGSRELRTGDIGSLDAEGNLHVHDRKKLLILRGGANVYPAEVERVIDRLPSVRASAVIGVADARLGQIVVAAVEIDPGSLLAPTQVIDHCRESLARYKVPERVVFVESLPRNAMGKVQRGSLAELFRE